MSCQCLCGYLTEVSCGAVSAMVQEYQSPVRVYKHPFELIMAVSIGVFISSAFRETSDDPECGCHLLASVALTLALLKPILLPL